MKFFYKSMDFELSVEVEAVLIIALIKLSDGQVTQHLTEQLNVIVLVLYHLLNFAGLL